MKNYNHIITLIDSEYYNEKPAKILYSLKDNIIVSGIRTTAGSAVLKEYIPTYDSDIYLSLDGYRLVSKDLLDSFACGSYTDTSHFGKADWPHPIGGSSGGTALNVLIDNVSFGIGTDTGGSVHSPAICCGLFAYKATRECVSRYGVIEFSQTLDAVGVLIKHENIGLLPEIMLALNKRGRDINYRPFVSYPIDLEFIESIEQVLKVDAPIIDLYEVVAYSELYSSMQRYSTYTYSAPIEDVEFNVKLRMNLGKAYIKYGWYDRYIDLVNRYRRMDLDKVYVLRISDSSDRTCGHHGVTAMYMNIYNFPRFTFRHNGEYHIAFGPRYTDLRILELLLENLNLQ